MVTHPLNPHVQPASLNRPHRLETGSRRLAPLGRLLVVLTLSLGLTLAFLSLLRIDPARLAYAASFGPTVLTDTVIANDGACTLREAIINANNDDQSGSTDCPAGSGDDTLTLAAGTYSLSLAGAGEDDAASGDLDITDTDALTITGAGTGQTIINANALDRVLELRPGAGTVVISGVTIFNGNISGNGGGINNQDANLFLVNTVVLSNSANGFFPNGLGGGVYVNSGSATLTGTQVLSNSASNGGGLYLETGTITANNGCIVYNSDTAVFRTAGTLEASDNWWGATNGPGGVGPGFGDSVNANVNYSNFKIVAPAGCPAFPPNLRLIKSVSPATVAPDQTITYTLGFSNIGGLPAGSVVISDSIPVSVTVSSVVSSGVSITDTEASPAFVWNVQDLAPGEGGIITITGVLSNPLTEGVITNMATITTSSGDGDPKNNTSSASITVGPSFYLPIIFKNSN